MCTETEGKRKRIASSSSEEKKEVDLTAEELLIDEYVVMNKSLLEVDDDDDDDDEEDAQKIRQTSSTDKPIEARKNVDGSGSRGFTSAQDDLSTEAENDPAYCAQSMLLPMCQGRIPVLQACQGPIAERFSVMSQCHHPMELLSLFSDDAEREEVEAAIQHAYVLPRSCEYCKAESLDQCPEHCQRPKSYFQKKRPPFCPPRPQWDPVTDNEIIHVRRDDAELRSAIGRTSPFLRLSSFFGRNQTPK